MANIRARYVMVVSKETVSEAGTQVCMSPHLSFQIAHPYRIWQQKQPKRWGQ